MNKSDVIAKVSEKSGVQMEDCRRVLEALEQVLGDELSHSKDVSSTFDKVYNVLQFFKSKKG